MLGIWPYHIGGEAAKLPKWYSDNSDKALRLLQQAVVQCRQQSPRGIPFTAEYTLDDFKDAKYQNFRRLTCAYLSRIDECLSNEKR